MFKWIVAGATEPDVVEAILQQWPDEQPKPLIAAAIDQIRRAGGFDGDLVRGWCFEAVRHLYRQMVEIGDYAGALRAAKQLWDFSRQMPAAEAEEI